MRIRGVVDMERQDGVTSVDGDHPLGGVLDVEDPIELQSMLPAVAPSTIPEAIHSRTERVAMTSHPMRSRPNGRNATAAPAVTMLSPEIIEPGVWWRPGR
jgi:hypothetical protein